MDINDQTDAFCNELQNVVMRFRDEFDLNHATIVGVLDIVKMGYIVDPSDDTVEFEVDENFWDDDKDDSDDEYVEPF